MKFTELKENEPLEVIEVTNHYVFPKLSKLIEHKRIEMRIFTDGEIEKESEEISQSVNEYYIGKKKYKHDVDTLKTKKLYFKNHSFIITYLITNEVMTIGSVHGWFGVVKDVKIFIKDSKDKKALKCAKQAIIEIENHNSGVDYSSLLGMLFSKGKELQKFETEKISKNVYSLKKIK